MELKNELILGTSKLGYLNKSASMSFLAQVQNQGISYFDTAPSYPKSEVYLGKYISQSKNINIFTKFGRESAILSKNALENSLRKSFEVLNVDRIYGLSIHNKSVASFDLNFLEFALELKNRGFYRYFGWCGSWENLPPLNYLIFFDYVMLPINKFVSNSKLNIDEINLPIIAINPFANFFWNFKPWNPLTNLYKNKLLNKYNPAPPYKKVVTNSEIPSISEMLKYLRKFKSIKSVCFGSTKIEHVEEVISINSNLLEK